MAGEITGMDWGHIHKLLAMEMACLAPVETALCSASVHQLQSSANSSTRSSTGKEQPLS